jgi:hypothetical protein
MVAATTASCGGKRTGTESQPAPAEHAFIILDSVSVARNWTQLSRCDSSDTVGLRPAWTVSESVAQKVDLSVRSAIREAADSLPGQLGGPHDYLVQYLGVFSGDKSVVLARGTNRALLRGEMGSELAKIVNPEVTHSPLYVCDAGNAQFSMALTPSGEVVRRLRFDKRGG